MSIKKFSAIQNTNLLIKFGDNAQLTSFQNLENSSVEITNYIKPKTNKSSDEGIKITEYAPDYDYYIPTIAANNIDITFNKILKLVKFENLTNMYDVAPINLDNTAITFFNSILDENLKVSNLMEVKYIKNVKYNQNFNSIDKFNSLELTTDLGYIFGQWLARGFIINKPQNKYNGCAALPVLPQHLDLLKQKLQKLENISFLHKIEDEGEYIILLNSEINNFIKNQFSYRKTFPSFLYDCNHKFIEGILHGIFHTNGTITFNKLRSRAFLTIKFINYEFAKHFLYFLMIKFGVTGSFSKMTNMKCCKISVNLNTKLKDILENTFNYHYTTNENKLSLWKEMQSLKITDIDKIYIKSKKSDCSVGYNLVVDDSKSYMLLNGIIVPTL